MRVAGDRFAIVPQFLLEEGSSHAVKLYAVLYGMGSFDRPERQVSRKKLAERMAASASTVDRTLGELEDLGALDVVQDVGPGGQLANVYRLCAVRTGSPQVNRGGTHGRIGGVPTGGDPSITELDTQRDTSSAFAEFWRVYPRHESRPTAERAFSKAVNGTRKTPG